MKDRSSVSRWAVDGAAGHVRHRLDGGLERSGHGWYSPLRVSTIPPSDRIVQRREHDRLAIRDRQRGDDPGPAVFRIGGHPPGSSMPAAGRPGTSQTRTAKDRNPRPA
jgi:hypothetical protein